MKKIVLMVLTFIVSFFFYNVKNVNSIDDIALIHGSESLEDQKYYKISFYDLNLYEIENIFKNLDIKIISIMSNNVTYEFTNISNVMVDYNKDLLEIQIINNNLRGFKVDSMLILSTKKELIKLESRVKII